MDIKNLNTFIQVAETGSFSRAGEKLGYSQPTVSVHIRQLEEEFGGKLFDRIGRAVRLTAKGRQLLPYAQQICRVSQQMVKDSAAPALPSGIVRLGIADSLCAPLIASNFPVFHIEYPEIQLEVQTAGTKNLFYMLDYNEVDIVCTLDSHIYDHNYIIAHEEKIGVHFVAAPNHPLANMPRIDLQLLVQQSFLLTEKGMSYRRVLDERLAQQSLQIDPVMVMGSADLLSRLVAQNAGISFLPDYVTESAVQNGNLVRLHVPELDISIWKQLLYRRDKWISPAMQTLIQHFSNIPLN